MKLLDLVRSSNIDNDEGIKVEKVSSKDIAIIGLSVRVPLADNAEEFWENVKNNVDCLMDFPEGRKKDADKCRSFMNSESVGTNYCKAAYLQDIDKFDYKFFNLSPKESSLMDPNQRLFLEAAWKCIEDAGYGGDKIVGTRTGVYLGYKFDEYYDYKKLILDFEPSSVLSSFNGNLTAITPSRIAYLLDLRGPSMLVETACSSSLISIHLACQSIRNRECDMAIAGGLKITMIPLETKEKLGIESSDGRSRTFDDSSDGTGMGEGIIVVLLKPLHKAIEDRDNIYAVIKGSAVNQDGRSIGLTAPNVLAQEELMVRAWKDAGVNPETITYIETHGTATKMGDPIEIDGIQRAFRRFTDKKQFCAVSSVKSNIGHLDNAAGVAGLLQAIMALKNKEIPPVFHFNNPNKKINFVESPVYVNNKLTKWETDGSPRRCGISSFGFSGTNCHVVLEEAPVIYEEAKKEDNSFKVLAISAKSELSLKELIKGYKKLAISNCKLDIDDICYTSNTGRGHYNHRMIMILKDMEDFRTKIEGINIEKLSGEGVYYGKHRVVVTDKEIKENDHISEASLKELGRKTEILIKEYISSDKLNRSMLEEICSLYIKGAPIKWDELYKGEELRIVSLPSYPFERNRCWVEVQEIESQDSEDMYFTTSWEEEKLEDLKNDLANETILVFNDEKGISKNLVKNLKDNGVNVIEINIGRSFEKLDDTKYIINGDQEDYNSLFSDIKSNSVRKIIHMSSLTKVDETNSLIDLNDAQKKGIFSLLYLVKALQANNHDNVELTLVSQFVNDVTKTQERVCPENATLFGFGKSLIWEIPQYKIKCIDIDSSESGENILKELLGKSTKYQVAYRNGTRFVEKIKRIDLSNQQERAFSIKSEGVYIITGGLGGLGTEISKLLASKNKVNIGIISRTEIPPKEDWDLILRSKTQDILCSKINAIKQIENLGAKVICYNADVSNQDEMSSVLEKIRKDYGRINGIVHCAGITDGNIVKNEKDEVLRSVHKPKVEGTWIISHLTKDDELDFFVMFSSAITLIGKAGGGSYTSANSYLDSFSAYLNKKGRRATVINWPNWSEVGMVAGMKINEDKELFKVLSPQKAISAFCEVLQRDINRIFIGEMNFNSSIIELQNYLPFSFDDSIKGEFSSGNPNKSLSKIKYSKPANPVTLKGKENGNYSATETQIAQIWSDILGFKELDVTSNFFEIGGDSIMITKMHSQMEELFPGRLTIADLFDLTSIEKLAEFLEKDSDIQDKIRETYLTLPKEYYTDFPSEVRSKAFEFEIANELFESLKGVSLREGIELDSILLSMYTYLITETCKKKDVALHIMLDDYEQIGLFNIDLSDINEPKELFRAVAERLTSLTDENRYRLETTIKAITDKEENTIIPLICKKKFMNTKIELLDTFDIIFIFSEDKNKLHFKCEYNGKRLEKEKVKDFVDTYYKLLRTLIS